MTPNDLIPGCTYFYATDTEVQPLRYQGPDYEGEGLQSGRLIFYNVETRRYFSLMPVNLQRMFPNQKEAAKETRYHLLQLANKYL